MNSVTNPNQSNERLDLRAGIRRRIIQVVIQFLLLGVILFVSAGRFDWIWAWVYLGMGVGILAFNALVMSPELIVERGRSRKDAKEWDKLLTNLIVIPTFGMLIVIGLDERFGWSPDLALWIHLVGLVFGALGQLLFSWAMASNKFFSTSVRIQMDRDHVVATAGPYQFVRHPGYVGMSLSLLTTPLLFGSLWALILAGFAVCLYVIRTALEDRTLLAELEGYAAYAQQVRHRLVPGLW